MNYKDSKTSLRFRILELICCAALIILGTLLLIFVTNLKSYVVLPVLVFSAAFALICFYNIFEYGSEITQKLFKSWIFFATAGMAVFFLSAGLLIVPMIYFVSIILTLTTSFAILLGIIFLLDVIYVVRMLNTKSAVRGKPESLCPGCNQPCDRNPEECSTSPLPPPPPEDPFCEHCRQKREAGIPCDAEICGPKILQMKSTQFTLEPSIKTDSLEKEFLQKHDPTIFSNASNHPIESAPSKSYHSAKEIAMRKVNQFPPCTKPCALAQSTKSIQVEPEPEIKRQTSCAPEYCRKKVLQITRSVQASPVVYKPSTPPEDLLKQESVEKKLSVPVSPVSYNRSPPDDQIIEAKECGKKKCKKPTCPKIPCSNKEPFFKSPKVSPLVLSPCPGTCENKGTSICKVQCGTQLNNRDKLIDDQIITKQYQDNYELKSFPSKSTNKSYKQARSQRSKESYKPEAIVPLKKFTATPSQSASTVQSQKSTRSKSEILYIHTPNQTTSNKSIQVSNMKECPNPKCNLDIRTPEEPPVDNGKYHKLNQTSSHLLYQKPPSPMPGKFRDYQTNYTEISPKTPPYIIMVKECGNQMCFNRIHTSQEPSTSEVKAAYISKEPPKDASTQAKDFYDNRQVLPICKNQPVTSYQIAPPYNQPSTSYQTNPSPKNQEPELMSIPKKESFGKDKNTQFSSTVYCDCTDRTTSVNDICTKCCRMNREDTVLQNQQIPQRNPIDLSHMLSQQPFAYGPKRNGLDEDSRFIRQTSPIFTYVSRQKKKDVRECNSERTEPFVYQGPKKRQTSLPEYETPNKREDNR